MKICPDLYTPKKDIGWVEKCSSTGHIASLLMTALGFVYEHQRPDRDKYVDIKDRFENLTYDMRLNRYEAYEKFI